jgi:SAM-dependent MidA family methyltransferase
MTTEPASLNTGLHKLLERAISTAGGWIGFDRFMALALYAPGLGYYANPLPKFGTLPQGVKGGGSDFVTAPELSPLFGQALAAQVGEALAQTGTDAVWEFGAGSGALAHQLLGALGDRVRRYTIVDLSGTLRARQQVLLAPHGDKLRWVHELPDVLQGVVIGNEVLDAMPLKLLARHGGQLGGIWHERGVTMVDGALAWADRPTALRPPLDIPGPHDYLSEIHPQAEAFIATLADRFRASLQSGGKGGAAFFLDYGFPESEYYHPQRHMGTVMCHQAHRADTNPLADVGLKDITAHVNFTGVALAGQDAGLSVLGYTSQARFLLNCGLATAMEAATTAERANALKLITEHEMGELFKVIGFCTGEPWDAMGFAQGDRCHAL